MAFAFLPLATLLRVAQVLAEPEGIEGLLLADILVHIFRTTIGCLLRRCRVVHQQAVRQRLDRAELVLDRFNGNAICMQVYIFYSLPRNI